VIRVATKRRTMRKRVVKVMVVAEVATPRGTAPALAPTPVGAACSKTQTTNPARVVTRVARMRGMKAMRRTLRVVTQATALLGKAPVPAQVAAVKALAPALAPAPALALALAPVGVA
jgi:hypothetical protein